MSEIREALVKTLTGVLDGKIPLDTADAVHLVAHRHVMDRYADDREARRLSDAELAKKSAELTKLFKKV